MRTGTGRRLEVEDDQWKTKHVCKDWQEFLLLCLVNGDCVSIFTACDWLEQSLTVVEFVAFDKAPSIDIDNLAAFPALASQHVEAADVLAECLANFSSIGFLSFAEMGDESERILGLERDSMVDDFGIPYFFAFRVPADDAVDDGRLAGLCMEIVCANGVDLDVFRVIDVDELFVDVRTVGARVSEVWIEVAGLVSDLDWR